MVVVHRQPRVRESDAAPLAVVRRHQALPGEAAMHRTNLPAEVVRVLEAGVGSEGARGGELVRGVAQ